MIGSLSFDVVCQTWLHQPSVLFQPNQSNGRHQLNCTATGVVGMGVCWLFIDIGHLVAWVKVSK